MNRESVLRIVGMHLNSNEKSQKTLAQIGSISKSFQKTFKRSDRQARHIKHEISSFVHSFLRKKKTDDSVLVYGTLGHHDDDYMIVRIQYDLDVLLKWLDPEYVSYYYYEGQHRKQDFYIDINIFQDEPNDIIEGMIERFVSPPAIYIRHEDIRSLFKKPPPTSRSGWKKWYKQIYTRSRTRGFFKQTEVNQLADALAKEY